MNRPVQPERDPLASSLRAAFPETPMPAEVRQALVAELQAARANWPRHAPALTRHRWGVSLAASFILAAGGALLFHAHFRPPVTPTAAPTTTLAVTLPAPSAEPRLAFVPKLQGNYSLTEIRGKRDYFSQWVERRLVYVRPTSPPAPLELPFTELYAAKDNYLTRWVERRLVYISPEGKRSFVIAYNRSPRHP